MTSSELGDGPIEPAYIERMQTVRRAALKLAETMSKPTGPPPGGFINSLPEAFGAADERGEVYIIGYKGEWFTKLKPSLRVRLHNWLHNWLIRHSEDEPQ